jgi:epoxyqueuosine reductase
VLIATGNSADTMLLPSVISLLEDPSPLVRAMAVWALSRLANAETFSHERAKRLGAEGDQAVRQEWHLGDAP